MVQMRLVAEECDRFRLGPQNPIDFKEKQWAMTKNTWFKHLLDCAPKQASFCALSTGKARCVTCHRRTQDAQNPNRFKRKTEDQ